MKNINWTKAIEISKSITENKIINKEKLIKEIELSDFSEFDAKNNRIK